MTVSDAPRAAELHASYVRIFCAMVARDARVVRRDLPSFVLRTAMQPLLFVFVFAYVLPKIGSAGGSPFSTAPEAMPFATILVPGLVATSTLFTAVMAVTTPLVNELSFARTIEDRLLAPVPAWLLAIEKLASGAAQGALGGAIVLPITYFVHATGQAAQLHIESWALVVAIFPLTAAFSSCLGLMVGVVVDPRHMNVTFTVVVLPITMLGCVYYPWAALESIRWLQVFTLFNPLVYASEGLRASLTSQVPHMPPWAFLVALACGTLVVGCAGTVLFLRKALQ